jgi:hypothetical protein
MPKHATMTETGHVLVDETRWLHHRVFDVLDKIGDNCECLCYCDECQGLTTRTLFGVIHWHRPKIDEQEMAEARNGRLFPGWRALCTGCSQGAGFGRHYPCQTMREICKELGVEIPEVLG